MRGLRGLQGEVGSPGKQGNDGLPGPQGLQVNDSNQSMLRSPVAESSIHKIQTLNISPSTVNVKYCKILLKNKMISIYHIKKSSILFFYADGTASLRCQTSFYRRP